MKIQAVMMVYNSPTMDEALKSMALQSVYVSLMICDNGSRDAARLHTQSFQDGVAAWGIRDLKVFDVPQKMEWEGLLRRLKNWEHMLARFAFEMQANPPDAVFILDSDVIMPPMSLGRLCTEMETDPKLGAIGVDYGEHVGHLRMGCTLYRYEAFKQLAEIGFSHLKGGGCLCRWMDKTLKDNGWVVRTLPGTRAEHRKEKKT